ncbi:LOW QUALITY PROTEIN: hypothetical protein TorRG33x02_305430 [Trema orientale]|uniref:Uncharacterized protein n=1 Tax=Trema orientale TaxID=63057 RepID=A0A2P5BXA6_TREOI|nr:LOW QUALITY PROTEIN: hypothetical protein TorRG33x02_305430 [Trema orientale]
MAACPHGSFPSVHPLNVSYLINVNGYLVLTRWWRKPQLCCLGLDLDNQWKFVVIESVCMGLVQNWNEKEDLTWSIAPLVDQARFLLISLELYFLLFLEIVTSLLTMLPRGLLVVIYLMSSMFLQLMLQFATYYQSWF